MAAEYLGSVLIHIERNLWWTFPVDASLENRARHAHVFHQDVGDFAFFEFFFYLTGVDVGDGAHACVSGSHLRSPVTRLQDRLPIRCWHGQKISKSYEKQKILVIDGVAGTGFAEDTLCMCKGSTPTLKSRLLLQIQYAYGMQSDNISTESLRQIT